MSAPVAKELQNQPAVALQLAGLSKTFPGTKALDDVEFEARAGEVHALVGQNGSGKSTLIKMLAGFYQPDSGGSATVRGVPIELGNGKAAHDAGLRFVHQDLGLVLTESAVDNFALGSGYHTNRVGAIQWRAQTRAAVQALERVGHPINVRVPMDRLSAVERTATAIARAMQDSDKVAVLVLDEPTATLPAGDAEMVYELVRRVRNTGASVIYVSHHLDEVFALADRVTVLRDGKKIATLNVADTDARELADMMVGGQVDVGARSVRERGAKILELTQLGAKVLKGLDLSVHAGEIVGVAGVNGSGRDEVAGAIFGAIRRTGTVTCADTGIPPDRPDLAVEAGIGFVPADRLQAGLVMDMSVRENITLSKLLDFWKGFVLRIGREQSDTETWIRRLGVKTPSTETPVQSLSGGNQQKVVLGKWLKLAPKVLLLDEPTQGIDVAAKAEVHRLIDAAAEEGAAVLVSSSDEVELVRLCSRVVVLNHGEVVADFSGDAINRAALTRAALGATEEENAGMNGIGL